MSGQFFYCPDVINSTQAMLKIGITGGMGSGKSVVSRIFSQLGIPVYNSDLRAKQLMHTQPLLRKQLIKHFGTEVYNQDNTLNRQHLSRIIFNSPQALDTINALVHPRVAEDFAEWQHQHKHQPYILKEAAILFESGADKGLQRIITVYAPEALRIERVVRRDNSSEKQVKKRIENQLPEEEKIKKSHFVIYNDNEQLVVPQVLKIHNKLLELSELS